MTPPRPPPPPRLWGWDSRWDLSRGGGGISICLLKEDRLPLLPTEQQLLRGLQVEGWGSLELTVLLKSDLLPKTCGCLLLGFSKFLEDAAFCPPGIMKACRPKNWLTIIQTEPGAVGWHTSHREASNCFREQWKTTYPIVPECFGIRPEFSSQSCYLLVGDLEQLFALGLCFLISIMGARISKSSCEASKGCQWLQRTNAVTTSHPHLQVAGRELITSQLTCLLWQPGEGRASYSHFTNEIVKRMEEALKEHAGTLAPSMTSHWTAVPSKHLKIPIIKSTDPYISFYKK